MLKGIRIVIVITFLFILPLQAVNLFVVGTGVVGSSLLDQIEKINQRDGLELRVVAIANSRNVLYQPNGIALNQWRTLLEQSKEKMNWERFSEMLSSNDLLVDCSSNQEIASSYPSLLASGVSIVTPNKKANSGELQSYRKLKELAAAGRAHFLYDANVGAGLPILSTIKSLVRQGDEIVKIQAVLSGTLSYLFNSFDNKTLFSDLVRQAQALGYTEPDPRDDLSGMDVMRKLLIIAREAGFDCELSDVRVERFLPDSCFTAPTVASFYEELQKFDISMSAMRDMAIAENKKLVFIAALEKGSLSISLQAVGVKHPFYNLSGCDNCISITTRHYNSTPLVIQGPGAGASVTAAKVLDNIIQLSQL